MRWNMARIAVGVTLCACAPQASSFEDAELDAVCGEPGPFRLLELDEREMPGQSVQHARVIGERVYVVVGDAVGPSTPLEELTHPGRPRLMSVGRCGETPRMLAEGVTMLLSSPLWPDAVLARIEGHDTIMVIDPEGVLPPRELLPLLPNAVESELGILGVVPAGAGSTRGTLVLQPFPARIDDPTPAQLELADDISTEFGGVLAAGTEAFALDAQHALRLFDLTGAGDPSTVAAGVFGFTVSSDARRVVLLSTVDDSTGTRSVDVLDRDTDERTTVAAAPSWWAPLPFATDDLAVELDGAGPASQRLIVLPTLETHDIPAGIHVTRRLGPDLFLGVTEHDAIAYELSTDVRHALYPVGLPATHGAEAAEYLEPAGTIATHRRTGPMWRVPYDGGERERIAERAAESSMHLPDGRVMTPVEIDEDYLGTLVVVEPDTLVEQRVDEDVVSLDIDLSQGELDPGVVAYGVRDGERSGIWLAKPAAHD